MSSLPGGNRTPLPTLEETDKEPVQVGVCSWLELMLTSVHTVFIHGVVATWSLRVFDCTWQQTVLSSNSFMLNACYCQVCVPFPLCK